MLTVLMLQITYFIRKKLSKDYFVLQKSHEKQSSLKCMPPLYFTVALCTKQDKEREKWGVTGGRCIRLPQQSLELESRHAKRRRHNRPLCVDKMLRTKTNMKEKSLKHIALCIKHSIKFPIELDKEWYQCDQTSLRSTNGTFLH